MSVSVLHRLCIAAAFWTVLLASLTASPARAQFQVSNTLPADGSTGVPLSSTTVFEFSESLSLEIDFNTAFPVYAEPSLAISEFQLCLQATGPCNDGSTASPRFARFVASHRADTDYVWIVDGVFSLFGSLPEPFVLHYTTASTIGQRSVSGSVNAPVIAAAAAGKTGSASATTLRRSLQHWAEVAVTSGLHRPAFGPAGGLPSLSLNSDPSKTTPAPDAQAKSTAYSTTRIFLLEEYDTRESRWAVRAADVIAGGAGAYQIDHVRSGATYWPLAVRYADPTGSEITEIGFYDSDGDGTADPVTVGSTNLSSIPIQLYRYPLLPAADARAAADAAATSALPGAALISVTAGTGRNPNGTAHVWTYTYYDAGSGNQAVVTVDPIGAETTVEAAPNEADQMAALPSSFVDTDEALATVLADGGQAVVDAFPFYALTTSIQGGDLFWFVDPQTTDIPFWRVRISGVTQTRIESITRYVDMRTGAILDADALPVELAGFTGTVDGTTALLRWTTLSETNNAGFWVEAAAGTGPFRDLGFVEGAGTTTEARHYRYAVRDLTPGAHRFRLRQIDADGTATLMKAVDVYVSPSTPLAVSSPRPHPISSSGVVTVAVAEHGVVTVDLFDTLGRHVRTLYDAPVSPGAPVDVRLSRDALPSGLYFIRARTGARQVTRPVTLVR